MILQLAVDPHHPQTLQLGPAPQRENRQRIFQTQSVSHFQYDTCQSFWSTINVSQTVGG